jgi:23S rRNA (pseudouridine1915-N3)-methyltransferase
VKLRISLIAVGRARAGPARELYEDYAGRIRIIGPAQGVQGFELVEIAESRAATPSERLAREGSAIARSAGDCPTLVLDERGENMASTDLARWLGEARDAGSDRLAFVIGGADGLSGEVRSGARRTIAFGRATWPHLMVRAMLAEQVYRALTILGRHPYHRG